MDCTYIVVVNCSSPSDAELLKHKNGDTKTWATLDEAASVVSKINSKEGEGSARVVAI